MIKQKYTIIYFAFAILVACMAYWISNTTKKLAPTENFQSVNNNFTNRNATLTNVDTFTFLVQKAYNNFATISKQNNQLDVIISDANQLAKDFYNDNDAILKFKVSDFGFDIKYNATTKNVYANFEIKNNGVNVPNDVLIKLADKNFNIAKSQNTIKTSKVDIKKNKSKHK